MSLNVKVAGTWRNGIPKAKVSGTWRNVKQAYVKVSGTWREILSGFNLTNLTLLSIFTPPDSFFTSLFFNNDGTKFYYIYDSGDTIAQYDLTTPYDITTLQTGTKVTKSFTDSTLFRYTVEFFNSGTSILVAENNTFNGDSRVAEYTLSVAYDISTLDASSPASILNVEPDPLFATYARFSNDGSKLFVGGTADFHQYNLSTPFDITSGVVGISKDRPDVGMNTSMSFRSIDFTNDGLILIIISPDIARQYNLPAPFDISGDLTTIDESIPFPDQTGSWQNLEIDNNDNTVLLGSNEVIYRYT